MKSVYKKLVSFQQAVELAKASIEKISETEEADLKESLGRILATNVYAPRNNPPFNRATMDGYAVRSNMVENASTDSPASLKISGESYIGDARKTMVGEGNCFKISTGAIVPAGSDAVVKVESTQEKDGFVEVYESVGPGENIAESGSDIAESELLLAAGKELETHDIAVLASLGISKVPVTRKLRVKVISTGNELISYNEPYSEGKINDANGVVVSSELSSFNCVNASYLGIVRDDYDKIKKAIIQSMEESDVVILSGGSSAGESDLVYRIIEEFDPGMIFHGVLVKPGLPTVLGKSGTKIIIGLPGLPVSALMIFRSIFLIPLLSAAGSHRIPSRKTGSLGVNLRLEMGKQNLIPVSVSNREGLRIYPVTGLSGSITRFASTSGFLSISGNTKFLESGKQIDAILWNNEISQGDIVISGMLLEGISDELRMEEEKWEYRRMLPRDCILSLSNGDSDIGSFIAADDVDLGLYIKDQSDSFKHLLYLGRKTELVLCSRSPNENSGNAVHDIKSGKSLAGPSVRLLKNIVYAGGALNEINEVVGHILTFYEAVGLEGSAELVKKGKAEFGITTLEIANKYGLKTQHICNLNAVYIIPEKKLEIVQKIINREGFKRY